MSSCTSTFAIDLSRVRASVRSKAELGRQTVRRKGVEARFGALFVAPRWARHEEITPRYQQHTGHLLTDVLKYMYNQKFRRCAMPMNCEKCNGPFYPHQAGQRFCCRACSVAWFANERREAVRLYRQIRETATEEQAT